MTATDEVELKTEEKPQLAPPPRWPPTALGAGVLPPPPPRRRPPRTTKQRYVVLYFVRRPRLLRAMAAGVVSGAFFAITRIGPHPFAVRGVVPVLAGGAAFGAVMSATLRWMPRRLNATAYSLLAVAGATGAAVWWFLLHRSSPFLATAVLGALLAQGVVAFETWLRQAAA